MQRLLLLLAASCVLSAGSTVRAAKAWKAAAKRAEQLVEKHVKMKRGVHHESEYQAVHLQLEESLKTAFAAGPDVSRRLRALLPLTNRLDPADNPEIFGVFVRTMGGAIRNLDSADHESFAKYAEKLWSSKKQATRDKTELQRVIIAQSLADLARTTKKKVAIIKLIHQLFRREVDLIRAVRKEPMQLEQAIAFIGAHHTPPTLYPILDAVDVVYEISFKSTTPNKILDPFLTDLLFFLQKIEIRVASGKGKGDFLKATDDASASQLRVWFRVTSILRQWTGEQGYVWFADWVKFWALYWGDETGQKSFDFVAARERAPEDGGRRGSYRVRSAEAAFYGIETKTSRFLIIVDVSGSMIDNQFGVDRLHSLKQEAVRFIKSLKPGVHYNILPFSTDADIGKSLSTGHKLIPKKLRRGKISRRTRNWINKLKADGMTRADLAFGAAFNVKPGDKKRGAKKRGDRKRVRRKKFRPAFSEIYFITDGSPTDSEGEPLKRKALNRLFRQILGFNVRHHAIIHTVGFRGMDPSFLQGLAEHSGGSMRFIDGKPLEAGGQ